MDEEYIKEVFKSTGLDSSYYESFKKDISTNEGYARKVFKSTGLDSSYYESFKKDVGLSKGVKAEAESMASKSTSANGGSSIALGKESSSNKNLENLITGAGVILGFLVFAVVIYMKRKQIVEFIKNLFSFNRLINSTIFLNLLELVLPSIFTVLFVILMDRKEFDGQKELIRFLFIFLMFFVVLLEWLRRIKDKTERPYYFKFLYIAALLLVFIFGILYINLFPNY